MAQSTLPPIVTPCPPASQSTTDSYPRKRTDALSANPRFVTVPQRRVSAVASPQRQTQRRHAIYSQGASSGVAAVLEPPVQASNRIPVSPIRPISPSFEEGLSKRRSSGQDLLLLRSPIEPVPFTLPSGAKSATIGRFNMWGTKASGALESRGKVDVPTLSVGSPKRLSLPSFGRHRTDGKSTSVAPSTTPVHVFTFPAKSSPPRPSINLPSARRSAPLPLPRARGMDQFPISRSTTPCFSRSPARNANLRRALAPPQMSSKAGPIVEDSITEEKEEELEELEELAEPSSYLPPGLSSPADRFQRARRLPKYEKGLVLEAPARKAQSSDPYSRSPSIPPPPPRFSSPLGPVRKMLPPRPRFPRAPRSEYSTKEVRYSSDGRAIILQVRSLGEKGQAAEMYRRVLTKRAKLVWEQVCEQRKKAMRELAEKDAFEDFVLRLVDEESSLLADPPKPVKEDRKDVGTKEGSDSPYDLDSLPDIPDLDLEILGDDKGSDLLTPKKAVVHLPPPPSYQSISPPPPPFDSPEHQSSPTPNCAASTTPSKQVDQDAKNSAKVAQAAADALLLLAKQPVDRQPASGPSRSKGARFIEALCMRRKFLKSAGTFRLPTFRSPIAG